MSKTTILILLIIVLGTFLRFFMLPTIPPGLYPDEAANGNNALEALHTGSWKVFYPENNGREGLFINMQALSLLLFGNEPWALRIVSAVLGTLTIFALFLLTKEFFENSTARDTAATLIALLASFFLATSFWHINFSRMGFRAIAVPLFSTLALYFLLKGFRKKNMWDMMWAGIFTGLGFNTYIAFRFMPLVLAIPIIWYLWQWRKNQKLKTEPGKREAYCLPCAILLFFFITFIIALPLGLHFLQNPQDFFGRTGQVSIFSAQSPLFEFGKSNLKTLGMFFIPKHGDCNWRHNLDCQPYLPYGLLAALGIAALAKKRWELGVSNLNYYTLLAWLFFMSLPATLTREGMPHALRSIGMIPPVMIFSALGAWWLYEEIMEWIKRKKELFSESARQLERIKKEITILAILIIIFMPIYTSWNYFSRWAYNTNTYSAFSTDLWHLGQYLNKLPPDTKKYVIVNLPGVDIRGLAAPAQTVMFTTDTFNQETRRRKNIIYVTGLEKISLKQADNTVIALLNPRDKNLISDLNLKYPFLKLKIPGDFITLEN